VRSRCRRRRSAARSAARSSQQTSSSRWSAIASSTVSETNRRTYRCDAVQTCSSTRRIQSVAPGRERAAHRLDLLVRHRLDRPADHIALDDPAEVVEAAEVVEVDARGDRGALRERHDEALGLEPANRLADRDVADAEALLELADADPLARLDLPGQQRPPQPHGHVVDDADALDGVVAGLLH
jgi:hypothetical protein